MKEKYLYFIYLMSIYNILIGSSYFPFFSSEIINIYIYMKYICHIKIKTHK